MKMLQPQGILEASLYVSDIERADEFYSGVLRLNRIRKKVEREVAYRLGETVLLLFRPDATRQQSNLPAHAAEGTGHLALKIGHPEIEAWRSHLQNCGVKIEKEKQWPRGGYSIYFRDPDSNCVELATADVWPDSLAVAK
jgi:catechol 2,3-dioxygenase-like lactoylglutathione lyase family enzyme